MNKPKQYTDLPTDAKPIPGFDKHLTAYTKVYHIDPRGNVYATTKKGRTNKLRLLARGPAPLCAYRGVCLRKNGKDHRRNVHRLLAEVFLEDWDPKLVVDHIDHNPSNNALSNLRMLTHQQNLLNRARPTKGYARTPNGRWQVMIRALDGTNPCYGTYDTEFEAKAVADPILLQRHIDAGLYRP